MQDSLLTHYERELGFIRRLASEFGERYPKIASRLQLERRGKSDDPHVERLIEAFALIAARVHLKLDDDFPEITQALLQVLYPHYLQPVPSMSIAQFVLKAPFKSSQASVIPRHQSLNSRTSICEFRTCYPIELWPIDIESARLSMGPVSDSGGRSWPDSLTLRLKTWDGNLFGELAIARLRVYLDAESATGALYESIVGRCGRVELRDPDGRSAPVALDGASVAEVGFGADDGMLPYSPRSFIGYRLLQEYFQFPEKYMFFELSGLEALPRAGFQREADVTLFFSETCRAGRGVTKDDFRLGCAPIVNLFTRQAEGITLDHAHTEYQVVPDLRLRSMLEVYTVDKVTNLSPDTHETVEFQPFYSFKHSFEGRRPRAFWHATRRPSARPNDEGTEVFLSLVDLDMNPAHTPGDIVTVEITCTNRDAAGELDFRVPGGDFDVVGGGTVEPGLGLMAPRKTRRAPLGHGAQWRLISHLSLNYLSPVDGGADRDPRILRELLQLYDFSGEDDVRKQIHGIVGVSSRHVMRRIKSDFGSGFARGVEATIEFDEKQYVGGSLYLFSSVLEKFLGLYVSLNSFSQLVATTDRRELKRWPPRTGSQALL